MAEGIIGRILGDDDEKPEVKATEALAGAGAPASKAARLCASDPKVAKKTAALLAEQARRLDIGRFGLHLRVGFQRSLGLILAPVLVLLFVPVAPGPDLSVWYLLRF